MSPIVNNSNVMCLTSLGELGDRLWEEKEAPSHDEDLGLGFLNQIDRLLQIDMISVLGHGEIDDVLGEFPEGTFLMMADMATGRGGVDNRHIPRPDEAAKDRLIGIGTADGPDLAMIALEDELKVILQPAFDFIDVRRSPIIPFPRMPLGVAMGEIRTGLGSGPLAHYVFAGDEVDAPIPPLVLLLDEVLDFRYFFLIHKEMLSLFLGVVYSYYIIPRFASQS